MAKTNDVVAEIKALIKPRQKRHWHQPKDPKQAELVQAIATAWLAGELGPQARPLAKAISTRLAASGVRVSEHTVREWLAELKRS